MTAETIAPLTEDERAVLMIAERGEYMIPMGRWERPIKSLAARGFMRMIDSVNYVITEAGRLASSAAEDDAIRDWLKIGTRDA
jgi:hypothetical protein